MNILNMAFNTINATRTTAPKGKVNVTNNVKLEKVEDANIGLDKTNTTIRVEFTFTSDYKPDFATIEIKGSLVALEKTEIAKKLLATWKKDKKIDKEFSRLVINSIMARCSIEAILLSRELSLPSPIPLPKIAPEVKK